MPDLLGHLVPQRDCRSVPAMTPKVRAGNDAETSVGKVEFGQQGARSADLVHDEEQVSDV